MKKETFYRTKRNDKNIIYFVSDQGYLHYIFWGKIGFTCAICKTPYGWDITHYESGLRICTRYFETMKKALEYITFEPYLIAIDEMLKDANVNKYIQELEQYKKEMEIK